MNPRFQDWIIRQHEKMPNDQKRGFLQTLKNKPDMAAQIIESNLMDWGLFATFCFCIK
jgi:hypothetical protein